MSRLDIHRKQAKQLVRWHREGDYSIGGRIRGLPRYETLTDREALALEFPLREAQEIIALEAGYASWAALKVAATNEPTSAKSMSAAPRLTRAVPVIFVVNVQESAEFFRDTLGFSINFLHGQPPFYGSVSRDRACVHLKFVHEPVLAVGAQDRGGCISVFVQVENVKALYAEYVTAGATFAQKLKKQAWGGRDFIVRDPDGNGICFVAPAILKPRIDDTADGATLAWVMNYQDRIVRDPDIVGGEPVLKGTRVTLRTVLASLAEGATAAEILADFPTLSEEDVRAAIAFAAGSAQEDMPLIETPIKR